MSLHRSLYCIGKHLLKPFNFRNNHAPHLPHPGACSLSVNLCRQYKMYTQAENKYAYDLLQERGHMKPISLEESPPELKEDFSVYIRQTWGNKSPKELCDAFGIIAKYCTDEKICISNKLFDDFIDTFTDNVQHFSDEDLKRAFLYLKMVPETESVKTRNFIEVWAALDDACLVRFKRWTAAERLEFAMLTFELNIARICDYTSKCVQRLTGRTSTLTVSQIVQTSFLMSVLRNSPLEKHNFELYLERNFDQFTTEDLAVMSMGFFKSKSPIRTTKLLNMIIERIIMEKEELESIPLAALLKLVRYSNTVTDVNMLQKLLTALESQVARLSVMACVHLALVAVTSQIRHSSSLQLIADHVTENISSARIKDLERLVLVYATLMFRPKAVDLIQLALDELRKPERSKEIELHRHSFACCVMYAMTLDYYPYDLINRVLDPDFIKSAYGDHMYRLGRELLVIDNVVQINCPDYTGHRLTHKMNTFLAKKFTDYVPSEEYQRQFNVAEKLVLNVMSTLNVMVGDERFVCGDHAVPHYQRADIFICKDKDGNPVDISEHFPIKPFGRVKPAPTDDTWISFIIAARNATIKNTEELTGAFVAHCRDLKKIGYHPAVVSWYKWDQIQSQEGKIEYLENLIKEAVKT